jgi:hypothetical protein
MGKTFRFQNLQSSLNLCLTGDNAFTVAYPNEEKVVACPDPADVRLPPYPKKGAPIG